MHCSPEWHTYCSHPAVEPAVAVVASYGGACCPYAPCSGGSGGTVPAPGVLRGADLPGGDLRDGALVGRGCDPSPAWSLGWTMARAGVAVAGDFQRPVETDQAMDSADGSWLLTNWDEARGNGEDCGYSWTGSSLDSSSHLG